MNPCIPMIRQLYCRWRKGLHSIIRTQNQHSVSDEPWPWILIIIFSTVLSHKRDIRHREAVMAEFRHMNTVRRHEELESWPHLCSLEMEGGGAFQQSILLPKSIYSVLELTYTFRFWRSKRNNLTWKQYFRNISIIWILRSSREYLARIKMKHCTQFEYNW